jgi:23S rRNA pseudouridine1911/1915/1917 synthase
MKLGVECVLFAVLCSCVSVDTFTLASFTGNIIAQKRQIWAKPSPSSGFDLEAIEAYELELDNLESSLNDADENLDDDIEFDENSSQTIVHIIPPEFAKKRIDAVLAALEPEMSRSFCGNLVANKRVSIIQENGDNCLVDRKSFKVEPGQRLIISLPREEGASEIIAQDLPLDIIFEDEHMIVINKAANMVVHPAAGNWDGTVVNALAYYLANRSPFGAGDFIDREGKSESSRENVEHVEGAEGESISFRPGIVHRLDKGTTGVLVVAKTSQTLATLSNFFAARQVKKTYMAITVGNPGKHVVIDKPIGRHPLHRQRMRVVPDPHQKNSSGMAPKDRMVDNRSASQAGRRALSYVDTLAFDGKLSLVQVRIETGRTHQIRVHLQDRHTPIYGDDIYGLTDWNKKLSKKHRIVRPLLHAYKLEINHPVTGEPMVFKASLADDMKRITTTIYPDSEKEIPDLFHGNTISNAA